MIKSFGDQGTEDIYNGDNTRAARKTLPKQLWKRAARKLDLIDAAHHLDDLLAPPGNRLEALKGDLNGWHSIRINDQYRVIFQWHKDDAHQVTIVDYH